MAKTGRNILRVGVTGGIGSGKSLVCEVLAERGIPVLSADEIAKELSNHRPALQRQIKKLLGNEAYSVEGTLNRPYVARRIFSERRLQQRLNAIVHPAVEKEIDRQIRLLEREGQRLVIVEAALVYEAGLDRRLDAVIVVDAPEEKRVRRVMQRDRVAEDEVRKRIAAQWPIKQKIRNADFVIGNSGSVDELREKVLLVYSLIATMAAKESV